MKNKKTQKDVVIARLNRYGYVNNFWAFHHYILRLGAIICELTKEGWVFSRTYGTGKNKKNYYYFVVKED